MELLNASLNEYMYSLNAYENPELAILRWVIHMRYPDVKVNNLKDVGHYVLFYKVMNEIDDGKIIISSTNEEMWLRHLSGSIMYHFGRLVGIERASGIRSSVRENLL